MIGVKEGRRGKKCFNNKNKDKGKMSSDMETKKVLEIVLSDEAVFEKIRERVFSYIDVDNNGTIDKQEIEDFVSKIC